MSDEEWSHRPEPKGASDRERHALKDEILRERLEAYRRASMVLGHLGDLLVSVIEERDARP